MARRILSLALIFLPTQAFAQENLSSSQNLTLRFYTSSGNDSCDIGATTEAITFTTDSTGFQSHCFNLAELFGGNKTSGFVNQTANFSGARDDRGISYVLYNADAYEASVNYSRVLYQHPILVPTTEEQEPGNFALYSFATLYGGKGCSEKDPNDDKRLLPWFGFSCISEKQGNCGTTPYSIQSFRVSPREREDKAGGKCWDFAERGQSGAVQFSRSTRAALLGTGLAVWLAW